MPKNGRLCETFTFFNHLVLQITCGIYANTVQCQRKENTKIRNGIHWREHVVHVISLCKLSSNQY